MTEPRAFFGGERRQRNASGFGPRIDDALHIEFGVRPCVTKTERKLRKQLQPSRPQYAATGRGHRHVDRRRLEGRRIRIGEFAVFALDADAVAFERRRIVERPDRVAAVERVEGMRPADRGREDLWRREGCDREAATAAGEPLYRACGYVELSRLDTRSPGGPLRRALRSALGGCREDEVGPALEAIAVGVVLHHACSERGEGDVAHRVDPEQGRAGTIIAEAARRRQRQIVMRPGRLGLWLKLIAPGLVDRLLVAVFLRPAARRMSSSQRQQQVLPDRKSQHDPEA